MDGDSCNNANALVANLDGSQLHLIMQMKNKKFVHANTGFNKKMDLPTSNYNLVANMNGNQLHLNVQLGGGELQHK